MPHDYQHEFQAAAIMKFSLHHENAADKGGVPRCSENNMLIVSEKAYFHTAKWFLFP